MSSGACRRTILARDVCSMRTAAIGGVMHASLGQKVTILTASAGLILLMLGQAGVAAAAKAPSAGKKVLQQVARSRAATPTPAIDTGSLSLATYPSWAGRFYSVSATSADDVWAAGLSAAGGQIAHWDGSSWADYDFSDGYQAVAAQSPTDAWAVGGTSWFYPTQTLARHWNGQTWTQVPTPTPGGSAWFNAVAATSPTNAWAVGCMCGGPGELGYATPLIEHWNGEAWTQQSFPLPTHTAQFLGVAAISRRNAWAVGGTGSSSPNSALIEHWNGYRWRRVTTPPGLGFLQGVAATKWNNVWAVGYNNSGPKALSLILHFNGTRWSRVRSPNPTGSTNLSGVSASSRSNAWAVGYTNLSCPCGTAAFHWNGKRWNAVTAPNPPAGFLDALLGVVAISPSDAWAVGTTDWSSTIIEHWNGTAWTT